MNFIRRIGRDEIYIKYVHQLVNVSFTHPLAIIDLSLKLSTDASAISKLRRGSANFEVARGPLRMEFELVCRTYGRPPAATTVPISPKGDSASAYIGLLW